MDTQHVFERSAVVDEDRYRHVRQYSLGQVLGIWAAAAVPMGVLAWIVAPWLSHRIGGAQPLARALFICFTAGLVWQFALVLILMRRELGRLEWSWLLDALWLRPPRDPNSKKVGGKVWWWAGLWLLFGLLWALVPGIPGPSTRDFAEFITSTGGKAFFQGAWGWWAVVVVYSIFNTVIGEELLFRGVLLPRMKGAFGKGDWVANGVLFGVYHLHQPWSMPHSIFEGMFLEAYPSRRFQSAWMGILVHSLQTVFVTLVVLGLVLK